MHLHVPCFELFCLCAQVTSGVPISQRLPSRAGTKRGADSVLPQPQPKGARRSLDLPEITPNVEEVLYVLPRKPREDEVQGDASTSIDAFQHVSVVFKDVNGSIATKRWHQELKGKVAPEVKRAVDDKLSEFLASSTSTKASLRKASQAVLTKKRRATYEAKPEAKEKLSEG